MRGAGAHTTAPALPLVYLLTAASAFVLASLGIVVIAPALAGHYYQPRVLALTHTVTLGWITLAILGATYQLLPLVLGRPLASERVARWQLVLLAGGIFGMVSHFWIGQWSGLAWAGGLVAVGVAMHVANVVATLRGLARWAFTARLVAGALVGLSATTAFGLALGIDKLLHVLGGDAFGNLHAHVHLGLLGWVLPTILGVAARVYPMFLSAREPGGWPGTLQIGGLALGAPSVVAGLATGTRALVALGAVAVGAAIAGHLVWMWTIVRASRRGTLDWPLTFALTGTAFLVPATVMGVALALDWLAGPRLALVYAVLALGGWVSLTIVGMMLKIVPFLVWFRTYGPMLGRASVPTLANISSPATERLAYALLVPGVVLLAIGVGLGEVTVIRFAGALMFAGALGFAAAIARVVLHLRAARSLTASGAPSVQVRVS